MATIIWERNSGAARPVYFPVSVPKLLVMSVCTFGVYEFYWFYMNWKLEQVRSSKKMMPFWRALFSVVWAQSLFERIARRAQDEGVRPQFSPSPMAFLFLVLMLSMKLPDPYWVISLLTIVPILRVHRTAIAINRRATPDAPVNAKFGALNILGVVIGGLALLVLVLDVFFPAGQI
jgi:hypothetical protein